MLLQSAAGDTSVGVRIQEVLMVLRIRSQLVDDVFQGQDDHTRSTEVQSIEQDREDLQVVEIIAPGQPTHREEFTPKLGCLLQCCRRGWIRIHLLSGVLESALLSWLLFLLRPRNILDDRRLLAVLFIIAVFVQWQLFDVIGFDILSLQRDRCQLETESRVLPALVQWLAVLSLLLFLLRCRQGGGGGGHCDLERRFRELMEEDFEEDPDDIERNEGAVRIFRDLTPEVGALGEMDDLRVSRVPSITVRGRRRI